MCHDQIQVININTLICTSSDNISMKILLMPEQEQCDIIHKTSRVSYASYPANAFHAKTETVTISLFYPAILENTPSSTKERKGASNSP